MNPKRNQTGLTLIELIITIVVLSVGVVGIVLAYGQIVSSSADPVRTQQAVAIAESYMEEILGRYCDYNGTQPLGASGNERDQWQYIQDYKGLQDSSPKLLGAESNDALNAFTVKVLVDETQTLHGVKGCSVTVTVDDGAQVELSLHGFRAP